ncbi:MAG: DNA-binding protein [Crocinitomicaceae bacterium]
MKEEQNIIIYNTQDGKASVSLYVKNSSVWMNQNQLAELFNTTKQNISLHIINILDEKELGENSVVKDYLTTAISLKMKKLGFGTVI